MRWSTGGASIAWRRARRPTWGVRAFLRTKRSWDAPLCLQVQCELRVPRPVGLLRPRHGEENRLYATVNIVCPGCPLPPPLPLPPLLLLRAFCAAGLPCSGAAQKLLTCCLRMQLHQTPVLPHALHLARCPCPALRSTSATTRWRSGSMRRWGWFGLVWFGLVWFVGRTGSWVMLLLNVLVNCLASQRAGGR